MKVIHGSLGDVFKQAIDAKIPSDAEVRLVWDEYSRPAGPKVSPEEMERILDKIAEIGKDVPYTPGVKYDREDIYFDHD